MSRPAGRPRAVFDCNTLVQATAFDDGPAAECLRLAERGTVELFVSRPILAELRRVLAYEEVRTISPALTSDRIAAFVHRLTFRATLLRRVRHAIDFARDPDDEPYIDLAIAAKANFLVTRDKDLLSLMSGHSTTCKQFRQKSHPLLILTPVAFLNAVKRLPSRHSKEEGAILTSCIPTVSRYSSPRSLAASMPTGSRR